MRGGEGVLQNLITWSGKNKTIHICIYTYTYIYKFLALIALIALIALFARAKLRGGLLRVCRTVAGVSFIYRLLFSVFLFWFRAGGAVCFGLSSQMQLYGCSWDLGVFRFLLSFSAPPGKSRTACRWWGWFKFCSQRGYSFLSFFNKGILQVPELMAADPSFFCLSWIEMNLHTLAFVIRICDYLSSCGGLTASAPVASAIVSGRDVGLGRTGTDWDVQEVEQEHRGPRHRAHDLTDMIPRC